jgi:hypothetical protein
MLSIILDFFGWYSYRTYEGVPKYQHVRWIDKNGYSVHGTFLYTRDTCRGQQVVIELDGYGTIKKLKIGIEIEQILDDRSSNRGKSPVRA